MTFRIKLNKKMKSFNHLFKIKKGRNLKKLKV